MRIQNRFASDQEKWNERNHQLEDTIRLFMADSHVQLKRIADRDQVTLCVCVCDCRHVCVSHVNTWQACIVIRILCESVCVCVHECDCLLVCVCVCI
jgi:hypothetical protein